jgi:hypothetical protein
MVMVSLLGNGDGRRFDGEGIPDLAATCLLLGRFGIPIGAYLLISPGNGDRTFAQGVTYSF